MNRKVKSLKQTVFISE